MKEKTFTLGPDEIEKFNKWREKKNTKIRKKGETPNNMYTYCFTPTGVGMAVVIKCSDGTKLDVTDYGKW